MLNRKQMMMMLLMYFSFSFLFLLNESAKERVLLDCRDMKNFKVKVDALKKYKNIKHIFCVVIVGRDNLNGFTKMLFCYSPAFGHKAD